MHFKLSAFSPSNNNKFFNYSFATKWLYYQNWIPSYLHLVATKFRWALGLLMKTVSGMYSKSAAQAKHMFFCEDVVAKKVKREKTREICHEQISLVLPLLLLWTKIWQSLHEVPAFVPSPHLTSDKPMVLHQRFTKCQMRHWCTYYLRS
jgi:hypothetical protein